jgi:hypothetical protein
MNWVRSWPEVRGGDVWRLDRDRVVKSPGLQTVGGESNNCVSILYSSKPVLFVEEQTCTINLLVHKNLYNEFQWF